MNEEKLSIIFIDKVEHGIKLLIKNTCKSFNDFTCVFQLIDYIEINYKLY